MKIFTLSFIIFLNSFCSVLAETDIRFAKGEKELILTEPNGEIIVEVRQNTSLKVIEENGKWIKVSITGWILNSGLIESPQEFKGLDKPLLELTDFDVKRLPADFSGTGNEKVILFLHVKNCSKNPVKAWKGLLIVKNTFGEELFRVRLSDGTSCVDPGNIEVATFTWEDKKSVKDEPYDRLLAYTKNNLLLELKEIQTVRG